MELCFGHKLSSRRSMVVEVELVFCLVLFAQLVLHFVYLYKIKDLPLLDPFINNLKIYNNLKNIYLSFFLLLGPLLQSP